MDKKESEFYDEFLKEIDKLKEGDALITVPPGYKEVFPELIPVGEGKVTDGELEEADDAESLYEPRTCEWRRVEADQSEAASVDVRDMLIPDEAFYEKHPAPYYDLRVWSRRSLVEDDLKGWLVEHALYIQQYSRTRFFPISLKRRQREHLAAKIGILYKGLSELDGGGEEVLRMQWQIKRHHVVQLKFADQFQKEEVVWRELMESIWDVVPQEFRSVSGRAGYHELSEVVQSVWNAFDDKDAFPGYYNRELRSLKKDSPWAELDAKHVMSKEIHGFFRRRWLLFEVQNAVTKRRFRGHARRFKDYVSLKGTEGMINIVTRYIGWQKDRLPMMKSVGRIFAEAARLATEESDEMKGWQVEFDHALERDY